MSQRLRLSQSSLLRCACGSRTACRDELSPRGEKKPQQAHGVTASYHDTSWSLGDPPDKPRRSSLCSAQIRGSDHTMSPTLTPRFAYLASSDYKACKCGGTGGVCVCVCKRPRHEGAQPPGWLGIVTIITSLRKSLCPPLLVRINRVVRPGNGDNKSRQDSGGDAVAGGITYQCEK